MKVSRTIEQACCILAIIAEQHGQPATNAELNARMQVSLSYLIKITRRLVVAGLIRSAQGVNGGFVLARPMESITLRMVVMAIDGDDPLFAPSGVIERAFANRERLARRGVTQLEEGFAMAAKAWYSHLDTITMQHIIATAQEKEL